MICARAWPTEATRQRNPFPPFFRASLGSMCSNPYWFELTGFRPESNRGPVDPMSYGDGCITKDPWRPSISLHVCLFVWMSRHAVNPPEKLGKFIRVVHCNIVACKRGPARIRQHFHSGYGKPCDWRKLVEVWLWSEGASGWCGVLFSFFSFFLVCLFVCWRLS